MTHKGKRRLVIFLCAAAVILVAGEGSFGSSCTRPGPLHEQIADYMYHSRTDPKLEYLIEKYGENLLRQSTEVFNPHDFRGYMYV